MKRECCGLPLQKTKFSHFLNIAKCPACSKVYREKRKLSREYIKANKKYSEVIYYLQLGSRLRAVQVYRSIEKRFVSITEGLEFVSALEKGK